MREYANFNEEIFCFIEVTKIRLGFNSLLLLLRFPDALEGKQHVAKAIKPNQTTDLGSLRLSFM